ncbi:MAG: hypothetical protein HY043_05135 [Verrucomicrobia bacterium]|nr:hypothetical protein [Verrucomicrobiota bacterium]
MKTHILRFVAVLLSSGLIVTVLAQTPHLTFAWANPQRGGPVRVAVLADGSLAVARFFSNGEATPYSVLAFLDARGGLLRRLPPLLSPADSDGQRYPRFNNFEVAFPDGSFLVIDHNGQYLLRLRPDGSLDDSFSARFGTNQVWSALLQLDGKIVVRGQFDGPPLRRILPDGSTDEAFQQRIAGQDWLPLGWGLALDPDGRILIITSDGGRPPLKSAFVRLQPDGTRDTTFHPSESATSFAFGGDLFPLPGGKVIVGRYYDRNPSIVDGVERTAMARLNSDGSLRSLGALAEKSLDPTSDLDPVDVYLSLYGSTMLADGRIVITLVLPRSQQSQLYRLLPNGSVDTTFQSPPKPHTTYQLVSQPDGKLLSVETLCAGLGGTCSPRFLKRFNADGSLDTTFDASELEQSRIRAALITADHLQAGRDYRLEASNDLRDWVPVDSIRGDQFSGNAINFFDGDADF